MKFIQITSFENYIEAHMVMGNLQEEDIYCWLKDEYSVTIDPMLANAIGGIKLMVPEAQAARAFEVVKLLQANRQEGL